MVVVIDGGDGGDGDVGDGDGGSVGDDAETERKLSLFICWIFFGHRSRESSYHSRSPTTTTKAVRTSIDEKQSKHQFNMHEHKQSPP